jgi:chromosome segregation ATPase
MMFENLDYVSTKTIRDIRDRLRELMDSMNDLTPEQLKQVMTQYEKLEQKLVKRSPFKTLTKDLKNYLKTSGDRKAANEAFRNAQKEYDAQEKNVAALKEKYEQAKANNNTSQSYLDFLKIEIDGENEILQILKEQLKVAEEKADKYNLIKKLALEELSQTATMVADNLKGLAELRDQMNELFGVDASKGETLLGHKIDGMIDGLAKASDGISKVTSSAQSGNVFGVVGGVVDVFTGIGDSIASIFGDGSARTKRLNREINESREAVRQLSMAYDDLERAINKSLGTGETEARRLAIANKEAQLAELERQKELEQSKRSKDRDDDAIKQYEESIHSLRNEIDDLKEEIINNLFGEDVKSAAEAFVDAWVQAWRAGETTLDAIQEKMDEMIYNLIKKAMTSKIVEALLNTIYKELDRMTKEGSEGGVALTTNELRQLAQQAGVTAGEINTALGEFYGNLANLGIISPTEESKELSALQQGIQGITEDTAGALEAYMNGVSQQVYYQSDLLTQIRDAVVSFDLDVQVATMSQILLQLQSSYTVQMSIQGILEGWNNPSGQAVRVELIS